MGKRTLWLAVALALVFPGTASAAGSSIFVPVGSMGTARGSPAAAPLPDGRVLVAGGEDAKGKAFTSAEVFDPATNKFSTAGIGSMGTPRDGAVAAPLPHRRVLIAGGLNGTKELGSAEVFDAATAKFSSAGIGAMGSRRGRGAVAAPLPDGRVLVAGGTESFYAINTAEVFDPATNKFSSAGIGSMSKGRYNAVAAPLPDGRVLIAGGSDLDEPTATIFSSAEVFDPATKTFHPVGDMGTPRDGAGAAPLPDGRVLVAGGFEHLDPPQIVASAEVFDPTTNTFSSAGIGSMGTARVAVGAAPLPDGRVLVAGGFGGTSLPLDTFSSAEAYESEGGLGGTRGTRGVSCHVSFHSAGRVEVTCKVRGRTRLQVLRGLLAHETKRINELPMGSPERAELIAKRASVRARIARLEKGGAKLIWRLTRGGHTVARGTAATTAGGRATIRLPNVSGLPRGSYELLVAGSEQGTAIVIR